MTTKILELKNIHYAFAGQDNILNGLNLGLYPKDKFGIFGPNGAGKSTMLHILMGLAQPQSGEISLFGHQMRNMDDFKAARLKIGFLFQHSDDQLFCPTVLDDVAFGPLNQGFSQEEAKYKSELALQQVGLVGFENRVPYRLSGGEKKLVALATILSMEPEILILDEPTTGLSPEAKERLIDILANLSMTRLIVSHEVDFLNVTTEKSFSLENGIIQNKEQHLHTHTHAHKAGNTPHQHESYTERES